MRAAVGALGGAAAGFLLTVLACARAPGLNIDFDRAVAPGLLRGVYAEERAPDGLTFAWTHQQADLRVRRLSRGREWTAGIRLRAARPDPATFPHVTVAVDGRPAAAIQATNDFVDVRVRVPPRGTDGVTLSLHVSDVFRPGSGDPRALGVMVDRIWIEPVGSGWVLAPRAVPTTVAVVCGAVGAFAAAVRVPILWAGGAVLAFSALLALIVSAGSAAYVLAASTLLFPAALTLAAAGAALAWFRSRGTPPWPAAPCHAALLASSAAALLKYFVLSHPDMPVGDAMFHAHRFEWVLDGRYFFTSVAPGGYQFPYPVGLYVFARPLAAIVEGSAGHMHLLRAIVAGVDACAAWLLFVGVGRTTGQWRSAVAALVLYHVIPLDFQVQATGNLTNAFAQSLAVAVTGLVVGEWVTPGAHRRAAIAGVLVAWAMLSHTSTFVILPAALVLCGTWLTRSSDPAIRRFGPLAFGLGVVPALLAVAVYYAHFGDTYAALWSRVGAELPRPVAETDPGGRTFAARLAFVPYALRVYFGFAALLLGALGTWALHTNPRSSPLVGMIGGWTLACAAFLVVGVVTPVDLRYYLAWFPMLATLGGLGFGLAWHRGSPFRVAGCALLSWAIVVGAREWLGPPP